MMEGAQDKMSLTHKKIFELKEEHLKLMKEFNVDWDDRAYDGAPAIDIKRPYGNSDVHGDMLEILGWEKLKDGLFKFTLFGKEYLIKGEDDDRVSGYDLDEDADCDELNAALDKLHRETAVALQICLVTQSFRPGTYECVGYGNDWKLVESV